MEITNKEQEMQSKKMQEKEQELQSNQSMSSQKQEQEPKQELKQEAQDTPDTSSNESLNVQVYKLYTAGKSINQIHKQMNIPYRQVWDMIVAGAEELGEEEPVKRGSKNPQPADVLPTKDKNKKDNISSVLSKDSVIKQVYGLHQILALVTVPEAAISESDAEMLGGAIYEVIKDSDLEWLSKYEKYINLAVAAAVVEVPTAIRVKTAMDAKHKKPAVKEEKKEEHKSEKIKVFNGIAEGEPLK